MTFPPISHHNENKVLRLVQLRFIPLSKLKDYKFLIFNVSSSYKSVFVDFSCVIKGERRSFHITKDDNPLIFQAVYTMSYLWPSAPRKLRYLEIYKCLEAINKGCIPIKLKAIRHVLSHSPEYLSRRETLEALTNYFGAYEVDLGIYRHLKNFYLALAELIVLLDTELYGLILKEQDTLSKKKQDAKCDGSKYEKWDKGQDKAEEETK